MLKTREDLTLILQLDISTITTPYILYISSNHYLQKYVLQARKQSQQGIANEAGGERKELHKSKNNCKP